MNTADDEMKKRVKEGEFDFPHFFDTVMNQLFSEVYDGIDNPPYSNPIKNQLGKAVADKRVFGFGKYGDRSYQASLGNLMVCPLEDHLLEELVDSINYSLALSYTGSLRNDKKKETSYRKIAGSLMEIYKEIVRHET